MKNDIMFLVPARMGFICRTKIFHYSLFLKNRLNKTPNSSPDQSLIAAFRKRNSNCISLKILLARMPLFFMSALVCVEIYCSLQTGTYYIKMSFSPSFNTWDFCGGFYWVKEIIDKQNSNTKNNEKWKHPAPNFWKLWTRNMISIFIGLNVCVKYWKCSFNLLAKTNIHRTHDPMHGFPCLNSLRLTESTELW
jgi:hypothetical protein